MPPAIRPASAMRPAQARTARAHLLTAASSARSIGCSRSISPNIDMRVCLYLLRSAQVHPVLDAGLGACGRIMRLPGRIVLLPLLLVQKRPDLIGGPLADRLRGTYAIRSRQRRIIPDSPDLVALALQYLPQLGLLLRVEPEPFREHLDATHDARPDRVAWRRPVNSLNTRPSVRRDWRRRKRSNS